ncbi:uncharacterized protein G2W53_016216 [Senna tora]|uniref:F-box associated domain-containing protein n=1 Tax=Senna tora TaxID=362788 RepID=A0A834WJD8_9FABA|nr:uncharacterized protein G2W53_016216 [Senna tora]
MLFCLLEEEGPAVPFFLQLDPVVEDEHTLANFSIVPNFFCDKVVTFVGCDEGVLCFRTNVDNGGDRFKLWNPVTCHEYALWLWYDHHTQEFYIPVIWDLPQEPEQTFMSMFCSFSCAWCDVPQTGYAASLLYDSSVYVDGCVNWLSTKKDTSHDNCHVVVSFKLQDRSWRITKVPFPVSDTDRGFINVEDTLGIATWSNVTEYHKTYVIWLSRELDEGEVGWQQFNQIDRSPAILRFLSFAGEYLICVSEKLQSYDEDEHTFFQGMIFLERHKKGIIRLMTTHCTSPFSVKVMFCFFPTLRVI